MPDRSPPNLDRTPLMERTRITFVLAIAAGAMDGFTFITANTFSTAQSGNVIQLGYWIAKHDVSKLIDIGAAILAFGLGVMFMALILRIAKSRGGATSFHVLFFEAIVLFLLGVPFLGGELPAIHLACIVSFLGGMQGGAFHRVDNMPFGDVAETLNVRLAFRHLAHWLYGSGRDHLRKSGIYFSMIFGFALGGLIGAIGADQIDQYALWVPASLLLILGITALRQSRRDVHIDPTVDAG